MSARKPSRNPGIPTMGGQHLQPGEREPAAPPLPSERAGLDLRVLVVALNEGQRAATDMGDAALSSTLNAMKEVLIDHVLHPDGKGAIWQIPNDFDDLAGPFR